MGEERMVEYDRNSTNFQISASVATEYLYLLILLLSKLNELININQSIMKQAFFIVILQFIAWVAWAQTAKLPNLVEIEKPVVGTGTQEEMVFLFECAAAWGDYNNDGLPDLVTSGAGHGWERTTILYRNEGNGTFTKVEHPFLNLQNSTLTWLDYNNDGNLDLFLTGIDDLGTYSGLFKNQGAEKDFGFEEVFEGQFEPLYNGGGNRSNRYVTAGDYNNDGWVDLYMQGKNEEGIYSLLYKNEKGLAFSQVECPVKGESPFIPLYANTASFGDYDNDGFLDILAAGYSDLPERSSTALYYKNNGDGTFLDPVFVDGGVNGEVAWCDYNNDGQLDFLVTGYSFLSGIGWQADLFENNGNHSFTKIPSSQNGLSPTQDCSIAWGDVNNDGFEDAVFLYSHPNALFLNNFGNKTFTRLNLPYANSQNYDQTGGMVCLVDFDRDNDLDVYTIGYGGDFLPGLFRNDLSGSIAVNTPPSMPVNLIANTQDPGVVSFSWDVSNDDHTPSPAIKYNLFVKKEGSTQVMAVLPADLNTGLLKVNENLAPIASTQYKLYDLEDGNYTFGVQAIDNGKLTSRFATASFSVGGTNSIDTHIVTAVSIYKKDKSWIVTSDGIDWDGIELYDVRGIRIKTLPSGSETRIDELIRGLYILKIRIDNELIIKKIVL